MKNLLVLILVLLGVSFAGKFALEKRYEDKLDEAISLSRGFVDIGYDDIKIGFDGSISINGLSIVPPGDDESIEIRSVSAVSSDRLFPIKGLEVFEDGKFPETFELNFSQLSAPVDLIEKSSKNAFENFPKGQECRNLAASFNYSDAGYSRIDSDIRMAFDFSDVYNSVMNIEVFDQTSSFTFEWIFDANKVEDLARQQTTELPVSEINATYELEPEAAENFVKQCADVFKVTPEVYLQKVVGSSKYSQNSFGADLGPEMSEALVTFMKGGSRFTLTSKPGPQLKKLEQLQFYKAKDVLRWMNLTIALNGEKVPLSASILVQEDNDKAKNKESGQKYTKASALKANLYIGRLVRIKRNNERKPIEGRLTGIDNESRLQVEMYRYGGLMTLTVGPQEIEHFEVRNQ